MKSVMSHVFSQVPQADIPRSQFNRSCGVKTTFDSGYLVPVFIDEALPGDTFNLKMTFCSDGYSASSVHGQYVHGKLLFCRPDAADLGQLAEVLW